jgi:hypothetical protein
MSATRLMVALSIAVSLAGCSRAPPPALECIVQGERAESASRVSHDFPQEFRLVIRFEDKERSSIVVGDVFGSQETLGRAPSKYYAGARAPDGTSVEDLNVLHYSKTRESPVSYESSYLLNIVSGQLYHEQLVAGEVKTALYAHCSRAEL